MLNMIMAILHSNSEVMASQPQGFVHVFTDAELTTAGEEILLLIEQLNKEHAPQLKQADVMRSLPPDIEKLKRLVKLGGQEMDGLIKPKLGTPIALEALRKELEAYLAAMPS